MAVLALEYIKRKARLLDVALRFRNKAFAGGVGSSDSIGVSAELLHSWQCARRWCISGIRLNVFAWFPDS